MDRERYEEEREKLMETAHKIEVAKRPAYTGNHEDVLHNFKSVAERSGITPAQAWQVYFLKHVDAICSAAKDPDIPQAEDILGRFADLINYAKLGWCLLLEESEKGSGWTNTFEVRGFGVDWSKATPAPPTITFTHHYPPEEEEKNEETGQE